MNIWNRIFILVRIALTLGVASLAIFGVQAGYIDITRYALSFMFTGGALCSVIGYFRYIPPGATIPALLALLLEKSFIFFLLGIAFLIIGTSQAGSVTPTASLSATYAIFAAAGASKLFTGTYVLAGAGKGWLNREVLKNPFGEAPKE